MDWETYQNAYQKAHPELRELLDSERIPVCVRKSLEGRGALGLRKVVILEVSAYMIGAQTIDTTLKNLTEAGITDALQLLAEIQTNLNLSPKPVTAPQQPPPPIVTLAEKNILSAEIAQTETAYKNPQNTTTPTYQSSQFELLTKQPLTPQVNTPPTTGNTFTAPRWDSDTNGSR